MVGALRRQKREQLDRLRLFHENKLEHYGPTRTLTCLIGWRFAMEAGFSFFPGHSRIRHGGRSCRTCAFTIPRAFTSKIAPSRTDVVSWLDLLDLEEGRTVQRLESESRSVAKRSSMTVVPPQPDDPTPIDPPSPGPIDDPIDKADGTVSQGG